MFLQGAVEAIIEVKHNRSQFSKVLEDIDFLGRQRRQGGASIRGFLIYASVSERPAQFTDPFGAAPGHRVITSPLGTRYKVRRVCRATSRIPSRNEGAFGHYAVLLEVI